MALRNARQDAIAAAIGNAGILTILDGIKPATGGALTNVLAQTTLRTPFAPAAANAILAPNLPAAFNASGTGTATWFRITTASGVFVMDGKVGVAGSDADMIIGSVLLNALQPINITGWTIAGGNP